MKSIASMLLLVLGMMPADRARPPEKSDEEKMQGTWIIVSAKTGSPATDQSLQGHLMKIKGQILTWYNGSGELEGTAIFKLNPKAHPKEIDQATKQGNRIVTILGIYAIENDQLKLCISSSRTQSVRPAGFDEAGGVAKFRIYILKKKSH